MKLFTIHKCIYPDGSVHYEDFTSLWYGPWHDYLSGAGTFEATFFECDWLVYCITVEAESSEEAVELAKTVPDEEWYPSLHSTHTLCEVIKDREMAEKLLTYRNDIWVRDATQGRLVAKKEIRIPQSGETA